MADLATDLQTVAAEDPRWANAGVTARRRDYWTIQGLLHVVGDIRPGSGYQRRWPATEVEVAARMVRLADAGLSIHAAERVARGLELAPGIRVVIDGGDTA